ncbi:heparinase II/III domain-containing protein [Pseudoduganella sp. OTU4001]|uniref:heparinase II/III domain-containing protein n=1 Tax=Pseudoduganella sp. OTU4001 TaxID=3043854 RepID=UPI00313D233A
MKFVKYGLLRAAVMGALATFASTSHADWAVSTNIEAIRPAPDKMQLQPQNPPGFSWSRYPTATASTWYLVIIQPPAAAAPVKKVVPRNWLLPSKGFTAAGIYTWKVAPFTRTQAMNDADAAARAKAKAAGATLAQIEDAANNAVVPLAEPVAKDWSTVRSFTLDSSAIKFEVPDNATLRDNVLKHGRTRMLAPGFLPYLKWTPAMVTERGDQVRRLTEIVTGRLAMAPVKDSDWPLVSSGTMTTALSNQNADIRNRINRTSHQLESASLLYRLKVGDAKAPSYLAEAIKRGDELAALNPNGPTSYVNQDQATRAIALSLSKALDMLWNNLDAARRDKWESIIGIRAGAIYNDLASGIVRTDQYPYDSHAGMALGFLALIATLNLGDVPQAQTWFDFAVRTYVHQVYTWSGPEGGYANGTAYAQAAADYSVQLWDPLSQALGVSVYRKPWSDGFLRFMAHFVPPGTPTHVFGDGHEDVPNTYLLKAFAARFNTPAAKWYFTSMSGIEDPLTMLQAPSPLPVNTVSTAAPPPNAAMYPSIGWAAMHSSLADMKRTSLYFKSSPWGAYNHSHGDQNSIVLNSGGKRLLIEAGYYDWYGSPVWGSWYRPTKSHNAVTFDNGVGQGVDGNTINLQRNGKLTGFSTSSTLDYVEGDATPAYAGALTLARRKVWYLRGLDAAVVMDTLTAPVPHSFEWNFHAAVAIAPQSDGSATIVNGDRSLCLRSITPGTTLIKRTGPAPRTGIEDHAAFTRPAASKAEFLVLLDVGCKKPTVSLTTGTTSRTLTVGGRTLTLPLP